MPLGDYGQRKAIQAHTGPLKTTWTFRICNGYDFGGMRFDQTDKNEDNTMTDRQKPITLSLDLDNEQAWNLAQFFKRLTFSDFEGCAVDEAEAYRMQEAVGLVQSALQDAGINPR